MTPLKLLFSGILISFATELTLAADQDFNNTRPLHYTIKLIPCGELDIFRGEYNVTFILYNNTQTIILHSENIGVYKAAVFADYQSPKIQENLDEVTDTMFPLDHIIYVPTKQMSKKKNNTLTLHFNNTLLHGRYVLNIHFFGRINTKVKGFFKMPFPNSNENALWILGTNIFRTGAREVFPCLYDLTAKTTFKISVRHDKFHFAVSSMPKQYLESIDNGIIWTHFYISPRMTTNEIAILILPKSNITAISIDTSLTIVLWNRNASLPRKDIYCDNLDVVYQIISFFKDRFGDLKIPRITFVAIPGFQHDTIVTLGLVLHREEDIMFDATFPITSIVQRNSIWRFLARQIALQWFFGSVKPSQWSYQWFNAVAEFFGIYALDKIYETTKMMNWFVVHTVHDSLHLDVDDLMEPISGQRNTLSNNKHFRVPPFIKVSALLLMIENVLEQTFWNDTKSYLAGEPLVPRNIWYCLLSDYYHILPSVRKSEAESCTLAWKWIRTSNYPLLSIEQESLCQYLLHTFKTDSNTTEDSIYDSENQYTIPTYFEFMSKIKKYKFVDGHYIAIRSQHSFSLATSDSIDCLPIVNVRQSGYYRVNYDYEKWKYPEMFITVSSYVKLPVLLRAQIIDDEYHLFLEKKKTYSMWTRLVDYLDSEEEYEVWFPMIRILEDMSGFLPFSDYEAVISFKHFIEPSLAGLLFHFSNVSDELNVKDPLQLCLRYEVLKWDCLLDGLSCQSLATAKLNDIINASILDERVKQHSVLWQEWIYCDGLRDKNVTILEKVILNSKFKNQFTNAFAKYISCLGFNTVVDFLNGSYRSYKNDLPDFERVLLFQSLVAKHTNNHMEEILENLSIIKPSIMKTPTALCIIINHIYSHFSNKLASFGKVLDIIRTEDGLRDFISVVKKLGLRVSQIDKHENKLNEVWKIEN